MLDLIQLILTFTNKRWNHHRETSSVYSTMLNSCSYSLNDNIENVHYVDDLILDMLSV